MSRKISFSGIILVGTLLLCTDLSAQRLCRKNSTGVVRWVSGTCPSGFTDITNSVRSEYLRANSVTTEKIKDGAVTDAKIAGVSASKVDFTGWTAPYGSVNSASVVDDSLTAADLDNDAVGTAEIQDDAVTSSKILDGTITDADFSSDPGDRLSHTKVNFSGWTAPNNSVATASIQDDAVTSSKILDGTITNADFSSDPGDRLSHTKVNFSGWTAPNNSVATASIQDDAVTSAKILNGTITNDDFSSDPSHRLNHAKVDFSSWTAPTDSVDTTSIQDGAVTNAKISINTDESLPYHTFLSTVNLTAAAGTGYIPLIGYNLTPQATETGLTASNQAFGCTSGTITVVLDTAPGDGNSRTFELRDGNTTITDSAITISDDNTTGSTSFSSIPLDANLVLHADVSDTPAEARATIYFVCK
jgi:hypothetical protein